MLNHCHCYIIIRYLIILFSVVFGINNTNAANQVNIENIQAELTWAEFDGENYEIFYSNLKDNLWKPKVQLTNNNFTNILPSISSGNDGITWIVWSVINGSKSYLFYCNYVGNSWSDPVQISTNFSSNTSPCIVVDKENIPWIVWAGYDGQDDDIFFTRWNGNNWDDPLRVNKNDSLPDILPSIIIDKEGTSVVYWSGFDGTKYRNYFSKWNGTEWEDEIVIGTEDIYQSAIMNETDSIPNLPDVLDDQNMASIHIKSGLPIQSIRLRDVKNVSESNKPSNPYVSQMNRKSNQVSNQVIVGFGDSITQGVPYIWDFGDGRRVGGYEPKLESLLNADSRPSKVLNYGNMGESSYMGTIRIGGVLNESDADCILILEGTNDIFYGISTESTIYNLGIMIDTSRSFDTTPILSTLTPDTKAGNPEKNIPTVYNPAIVNLSAKKSVTLCDQYNGMVNNWSSLTDDGTHPNDSGYQVMAQTWFNSIPAPSPEPEPPSSGGGGGGCFIATAAFGSSLEREVGVLKEFRDKYLMPNAWGREFVEYYYKTSPQIADIIINQGNFKLIIKTALYPLVGFCYVMLNSSTEDKIIIFIFLLLFIIGIGSYMVRVRIKRRSI